MKIEVSWLRKEARSARQTAATPVCSSCRLTRLTANSRWEGSSSSSLRGFLSIETNPRNCTIPSPWTLTRPKKDWINPICTHIVYFEIVFLDTCLLLFKFTMDSICSLNNTFQSFWYDGVYGGMCIHYRLLELIIQTIFNFTICPTHINSICIWHYFTVVKNSKNLFFDSEKKCATSRT